MVKTTAVNYMYATTARMVLKNSAVILVWGWVGSDKVSILKG